MSQNEPRSLKELWSLHGKTSLVTGGAGWLGRAISHAQAELGASVAIASRDLNKCKAWCDELAREFPSQKFLPLAMDVTRSESVTDGARVVRDQLGDIDILVNNAWSGKKNTWRSITEPDWRFDIEVSLNAVFLVTKAFHESLVARRGVVINVSSMYGHVAPDYRMYEGTQNANPPSYGAAKAGVIQLTRYLASFLAPEGIRVNCISPGAFPHPATQNQSEFISRLCKKNPLGRIGQPEDLKGVVALLSSDASSYITGQNLCVDGGWAVW